MCVENGPPCRAEKWSPGLMPSLLNCGRAERPKYVKDTDQTLETLGKKIHKQDSECTYLIIL